MLLLASFIAYFSKMNYSQRQIILKIFRVWERSPISVPIGGYFGLIEVGTWLGESIAKKGEKTAVEDGPDVGTELTHGSIRSVHQEEMQVLKETRRWTMFHQRPVTSWIHVWLGQVGTQEWPDSGLHLVWSNWMRPVMFWGSLDLSVLDRTTGGNVRSFSPVHPIATVKAK